MNDFEDKILALVELLPLSNRIRVPIDENVDIEEILYTKGFEAYLSSYRLEKAIFDPNSIFTILNCLRMEDGYVLDFCYLEHEHFDGFPVLYARRADSKQLEDAEDVEKLPEHEREFPYHVITQNTSESYFQLALFKLIGNKFFLTWHANYMRIQPVCGERTISMCGDIMPGINKKVPDDILDEAKRLDLEPVVELLEGEAKVTVVVFSPWGGFSNQILTFCRKTPHKLMSEERIPVVEYNCRVVF